MAIDKQDTLNAVVQVVSEKLKTDKDIIIKAHSFQDLGVSRDYEGTVQKRGD